MKKANLVHQDHQDHEDQKDQKDRKDLKDHQVFQDLKVKLVYLEVKENQEKMD